jgi:hypothetical protein
MTGVMEPWRSMCGTPGAWRPFVRSVSARAARSKERTGGARSMRGLHRGTEGRLTSRAADRPAGSGRIGHVDGRVPCLLTGQKLRHVGIGAANRLGPAGDDSL